MKVSIGNYPGPRSKKERKVSVKIDKWDTWNADHTIALIALPLLQRVKQEKQGSPFVDDEDVPDNLKSINSVQGEAAYDLDSNFHARWDYVIDEIIFAISEVASGLEGEHKFYDHSDVDKSASINKQISQIKVDRQGLAAYYDRLHKGCILFGKYFMNLST